MKKLTALLLAMMMMLCSVAALADETASDEAREPLVISTDLPIDIQVPNPENANVDYYESDGTGYIIYSVGDAEDTTTLQYYVTIAMSDETMLSGKDLADATDEEIEELFKTATAYEEGEEQPYTYTVVTFDDGTKALNIIDETQRDSAWVLTVKNGVFVQVFAWYYDMTALSDSEIQDAVKLMDDLQFFVKDETTTTAAE